MENHIKIVALGNMALGALSMLAGVVVVVAMGGAGLLTGELGSAIALGSLGLIIGMVVGVLGLPQFIGGLGLLGRKNWARYVLMVTSAISLLGFPVGTLLGGYSLWVLTNNDTKMLTAG
jgi:hypothetical protein